MAYTASPLKTVTLLVALTSTCALKSVVVQVAPELIINWFKIEPVATSVILTWVLSKWPITIKVPRTNVTYLLGLLYSNPMRVEVFNWAVSLAMGLMDEVAIISVNSTTPPGIPKGMVTFTAICTVAKGLTIPVSGIPSLAGPDSVSIKGVIPSDWSNSTDHPLTEE